MDLPFLELDQELWDRDKRASRCSSIPAASSAGSLPLKEIGPAIEAGKSYTLVIDREWPDGRGAPLAEAVSQDSSASGPPDRTPHRSGEVAHHGAARRRRADAAGDRFPKPLDYALLQHSHRSARRRRERSRWGATRRSGDSRRSSRGSGASIEIVVQTTLEDLAGNHVGRAFDVDTFKAVTKEVARETLSLRFRPKS